MLPAPGFEIELSHYACKLFDLILIRIFFKFI